MDAGVTDVVISSDIILGGAVEINVGENSTLTISGDISGDYSLTKTGLGTLILTGDNTYTGDTTIANGTVSVSSIVVTGSSNLGNAASAVVLGDESHQGVLSFTGTSANYTRGFTIAAGGGEIDTTASGQALGITTGGISDGGVLTIGGPGYTAISSIISGSGSLTKTGTTGTLYLIGANTYSGNTTISDGVLVVVDANALSHSTLDYNSYGGSLIFVGTTTATFGGLEGNQNLPLTNGGSQDVALTVGGNDATTTYSGALSGGGSVTKTGSGTLTLTGSNTYTGDTTINDGALCVTGSITSTVTVASGATLSGTGSVGAVTANGIVSPGVSGVGTLDTGNLAFGTGSQYNVNMTDDGCDQVNVTGTVTLGNATLDVTSSRAHVANDVLVLVQNDGTDSTGTFLDLDEGAEVDTGFVTYWITYCYNAEAGTFGDGNDVALIESIIPNSLTWDPDGVTDESWGGTGDWTATNAWVDRVTGTRYTWDSSCSHKTAEFTGTAGTVTVDSSLSVGSIVFHVSGYTVAVDDYGVLQFMGDQDGNASVTGTGDILLQTGQDYYWFYYGGICVGGWGESSPATLTVGSDVLIHGFGIIGSYCSNDSLYNEGTIQADAADKELALGLPESELSWTNVGTFAAVGSGILAEDGPSVGYHHDYETPWEGYLWGSSSALSGTEVALSWDGFTGGEWTYTIEASLDANEDNIPDEYFTVATREGVDDDTPSTFMLSGLDSGESYYVRIVAEKTIGEGQKAYEIYDAGRVTTLDVNNDPNVRNDSSGWYRVGNITASGIYDSGTHTYQLDTDYCHHDGSKTLAVRRIL